MIASYKSASAVRRLVILLALPISVIFITLLLTSGPAWSIELDQPSSVVQTDDKIPYLSNPSPVPANADACLSLLKTVNFSPANTVKRDRRDAGKAAALGLVFGVRFALGPKEITRSKRKKPVTLDVWTPREDNSRQALAVAEYRRCKNEQALKAISDWRWAR